MAKERALLSYDTQVEAMQKQLLSFLRQNELFEKIEFSAWHLLKIELCCILRIDIGL